MRNHVIDNSKLLAKQKAECRAYQAAKETARVLTKYARARALKAVEEAKASLTKKTWQPSFMDQVKAEDIRREARLLAIADGLIRPR